MLRCVVLLLWCCVVVLLWCCVIVVVLCSQCGHRMTGVAGGRRVKLGGRHRGCNCIKEQEARMPKLRQKMQISGRPSFGALGPVGGPLDMIYQERKKRKGEEKQKLEEGISTEDLTRQWP